MDVVGTATLGLALVISLLGIVLSLIGARRDRREFTAAGRRCVFVLAGLMIVSFGILEIAFATDDFAFRAVATHSSTTTPLFYKLTAAWSSQEGSLLLWALLLSIWSSIVLLMLRRRLREIAPYATAILLGFAAFFCFIMLAYANPFELSSPVPLEGTGLNPLLRHPSMMFHPPMLYSGYTLMAIPFAFAAAALITRKVDAAWISSTRRYALAAWACLGIGILLGARWSYAELGWGGYWAWDPVENAALLPWLTVTAFLHSAMIQEKRGMLKTWNASLILASGILAILGTFLVRSGVINSIHAFGASTLGVPFVILIASMIVFSIYLLVTRRKQLRSEHRIDSLLSREAIFLLNNLVLVALAFVVFWGTFFPLISEALTGTEAAVGPPWFNRYVTPLAIILVLLSGLAPMFAWKRSTPRRLLKTLAWPTLFAAIVGVLLAVFTPAAADTASMIMFVFAAFVLGSVVQEFARGTWARKVMTGEALPRAFVTLVARNRRRYGGYIVHIGIALMFVGVAASSAFQTVVDAKLLPGQTADVAGYKIRYLRASSGVDSERIALGAVLQVSKDGKQIATLRPNRSYFPASGVKEGLISRYFDGEATSEIAMDPGTTRDIWTAVQPNLEPLRKLINEADRRFPDASPVQQGVIVGALLARYEARTPPANFRMIVSPLVLWIWVGGIVVALGALLAAWPARAAKRKTSAEAAGRLARELGSS